MKPLTEGSMLHAKKKRNNVKKETKHNKGTHTQISLCNIMMGSLLVGSAIILIAAVFNFLGTTYIVSIAISLGVIYLLPNFINRTTPHVTKMKYDAFIVWFIIFFGPVMTIFILAIFLLPPTFMSESIAKKKVKKKIKHNKNLHTKASLYNIMSVSLLFGVGGAFLAKTLGVLLIVHIVSIFISLGALHLLPAVKSINIAYTNYMKYNIFTLFTILLLGPITTLFILTVILLPPKKKAKAKESDETK